MSAPRIYMRAIANFSIGDEDIQEDDLLALAAAEAGELMARGLVAPAGSLGRISHAGRLRRDIFLEIGEKGD